MSDRKDEEQRVRIVIVGVMSALLLGSCFVVLPESPMQNAGNKLEERNVKEL